MRFTYSFASTSHLQLRGLIHLAPRRFGQLRAAEHLNALRHPVEDLRQGREGRLDDAREVPRLVHGANALHGRLRVALEALEPQLEELGHQI